MTDADVRKRCEAWAAEQGLMEYDFVGNGGWGHTGELVELVKSAYADGQRDGMELAAIAMCFCCARPGRFFQAEFVNDTFYHRGKLAPRKYDWACTASAIHFLIRLTAGEVRP